MTTTPEPQETPMPDPTRPDDRPNDPVFDVREALELAHPEPCTVDQLAEVVGEDWDVVRRALADLEHAGDVTPSTRDDDAVWMLHGPARRAADEATRDA